MNQTISSTLRRGIAILSLCVLVATATATWLSTVPASAASAQAPRSTAAPAQAVPAQRGTASADKPRRRGKGLRGKLNLNTATEEQLQMLPGVGPAKARRIVAYRQKHGKFRRVVDLRRVKGFGYKTLKKLAPYLAVDGPNSLTSD